MEKRQGCPVLDIVVPVHNEERALSAAIEQLTPHLATLPWPWRITIADNASTDATSALARDLTEIHPGVQLVSLALKGRGRALKPVWLHSDMAIGSRLGPGSRVTRGPKRELVSRSYNALLKTTLHTGFSDAQCRFKAIRRDVAAARVPLVLDDDWFFDTELLVLAERAGLRIHEMRVDWVDDLDSRVNVRQSTAQDLRGVGRQSFSDRASNALALLATTIANAAANRRITFGVRGPWAWRHQAQALAVLALGLGLTSTTLWTLNVLSAGRSHLTLESWQSRLPTSSRRPRPPLPCAPGSSAEGAAT